MSYTLIKDEGRRRPKICRYVLINLIRSALKLFIALINAYMPSQVLKDFFIKHISYILGMYLIQSSSLAVCMENLKECITNIC